MRFCNFPLLLLASALFSFVAGKNNALEIGLSDELEDATEAQLGEDNWNRLLESRKSCPYLSITTAIPCMLACVPNPLCITKCFNEIPICPCLKFLPDTVTTVLKGYRICP
ncbi:hypothetical protein FRB95_003489 [Tulasnella sp. JGI-2019a]|nr:hypothetical protein FRB95_003489 [Tulasnella sp. JGI-2019a]